MSSNLCKCKKFSGYTKGYFCRACGKCIYTQKQIKEIDEFRRMQSDTKRIWEKANITDVDVAYWCGEENGKLDNQERIKAILGLLFNEIYEYGKFTSKERAEFIANKIRKL